MQDMLNLSTGKIRNRGYKEDHELPYCDRFSSTKNIGSKNKVSLPALGTLDSKQSQAFLHNDQLQQESIDFSSIKR